MHSSCHPVFHVDDASVQSAVRIAVLSATAALDATFPGGDKDGVSSNFAGLLEKAMLSMLAGEDPLRDSRTATHLNRLIYTDASFGDPRQAGDKFVVARRMGERWDEEARRNFPVMHALDANTRRFVPFSDGESVAPSITFAGAVQEAMIWLRREGLSQEEAQLSVVAVEFSKGGYRLKA